MLMCFLYIHSCCCSTRSCRYIQCWYVISAVYEQYIRLCCEFIYFIVDLKSHRKPWEPCFNSLNFHLCMNGTVNHTFPHLQRSLRWWFVSTMEVGWWAARLPLIQRAAVSPPASLFWLRASCMDQTASRTSTSHLLISLRTSASVTSPVNFSVIWSVAYCCVLTERAFLLSVCARAECSGVARTLSTTPTLAN